jgi:integrase
MPKSDRIATRYPGVFYVIATDPATQNEDRVIYIRYYRDGKQVEEKAGWQGRDKMTPAVASRFRASRMSGKQLSNQGRREKENIVFSKWTVDKLWDEYKTHKILKGIVKDANRYKNHIAADFGNYEPKDITPQMVDKKCDRMLKTHAPATTKHTLTLMRRIINFGVSRQLCEGLTFKMQLPRVDNIKTEYLTADELKRLHDVLDEWNDIQVANIMRIALYTGMRRGEIFRLKWSDIDFRRGFIHIREPKGGKSEIIPLNKHALHVLEEHPRTKNSLYVFPGKYGDQRKHLKSPLLRIKKLACLPDDFRPLHGLRHTYASTLAESGVDLYTIQRLLTHKDPTTTQRYAHLRDEALMKASEIAGDKLGKDE